MKIQALETLLLKLAGDNPSWPNLTKTNLTCYMEVLEDIPDDIFDKAAKDVRRTKFFSWPGAAEIYQACKRYMAPDAPVISEGERLWIKTLLNIRDQKAPAHDEWYKVQGILDYIGCCYDILTANDFELNKMEKTFIKLYNAGVIKQRDKNGQITTE